MKTERFGPGEDFGEFVDQGARAAPPPRARQHRGHRRDGRPHGRISSRSQHQHRAYSGQLDPPNSLDQMLRPDELDASRRSGRPHLGLTVLLGTAVALFVHAARAARRIHPTLTGAKANERHTLLAILDDPELTAPARAVQTPIADGSTLHFFIYWRKPTASWSLLLSKNLNIFPPNKEPRNTSLEWNGGTYDFVRDCGRRGIGRATRW
jgi:hypothetical protein